MSNRRSSLYCAARPLILSLIPVLTCTTAGAQSLYTGASEHYAKRTGYSGYAAPYRSNFSAPNYAGRPAWAQTPVQSQYGTGTTRDGGGRPVWSPSQQSAPVYGSSFPAPNYNGRQARSTWPQAPAQSPYGPAISNDGARPPRPTSQQGPIGSVNGSPNIGNSKYGKGSEGGSPWRPPQQTPKPTGTPGGHTGDGGSTRHPPQTGAPTGNTGDVERPKQPRPYPRIPTSLTQPPKVIIPPPAPPAVVVPPIPAVIVVPPVAPQLPPVAPPLPLPPPVNLPPPVADPPPPTPPTIVIASPVAPQQPVNKSSTPHPVTPSASPPPAPASAGGKSQTPPAAPPPASPPPAPANSGTTSPASQAPAQTASPIGTSLGALGALALALPLARFLVKASRRKWQRDRGHSPVRIVLVGDQGETRMIATGAAPAEPVIELRLLTSPPVSTLRLAA